MDYQKTLNLPQTDFAMKANLALREPDFLRGWEEKHLYQLLREKSKGSPAYILHDGPPYANGNIHIGHALNKILKDFIIKFKSMQGFDCKYIPGWDCHGLPIEHQLFKDLKKRKSEVNTIEFRKMAYDYAMKYVGLQRSQFQRLGIFGEWDNPYLTLSAQYEYWILDSFIRLVQKGYVYRGLKPVNWCIQCETALAEAEVEYENHTSQTVYVKLRVNNQNILSDKLSGKNKPVYLLVWTTTPWTLIANVAVAAHQDYEYVGLESGKEILILEETLQEAIQTKTGNSLGTPVFKLKGSELKELTYDQPFGMNPRARVINADYVTRNDGTGLVHIAPGHGQEDFEAGRRYDLEVLMPVNDHGVYIQGPFTGQNVFKAQEAITTDLKLRDLLLHHEPLTHSYPHCWRCKRPIIFRATKQWFLKIDHDHLREHLLDTIKKNVNWIPASGQERIASMVVSRPDWCLSRQRHWGVPIPALYCQGCKENRLYPQVMNNFNEQVKQYGTDIWFSWDLEKFLPAGFQCPLCNGKEFEKTGDILDVWFDSGASHQAVIEPALGLKPPVDLYLEGSDQHRGWFQSSLILSQGLNGQAPFRSVLTHGFVVDGQGRKMSKSLGNVVAPDDVLKNYGADILRLWVSASNYHEDIRLSKEILDRLIDAYRKIRNTLRYLLGNLSGFIPDQEIVPYDELLSIDKWALSRLYDVIQKSRQAYERFDFPIVYQTIYSFCNDDLSGFYLDILKDRLYTSHAQSLERKSSQTVLYHILNHLLRLLAPILVFSSEEVFAAMPKESSCKDTKSVHLLNWLPLTAQWDNQGVIEEFALFLKLRPFVLKALEDQRSKNIIGSSLEAQVNLRCANKSQMAYWKRLEPQLRYLLIVSQVHLEFCQPEQIKAAIATETQLSETEIEIKPAAGQKCSRCWNFSEMVGQDQEHPTLCQRCVPVVTKVLSEKPFLQSPLK